MRKPNGICPHCQTRRRVIEIHRTGGGMVARMNYAPCSCPKATRQDSERHVRQIIATFAILPFVLISVVSAVMRWELLLFLSAAAANASMVAAILNRPRSR